MCLIRPLPSLWWVGACVVWLARRVAFVSSSVVRWVADERAFSNMSEHRATSTLNNLDDSLHDLTLQEVLKACSDRYHIELQMHKAPAARSIIRAAKPDKDKAPCCQMMCSSR